MIESGKGLIAKYNFDEEAHYKYINKIIMKIQLMLAKSNI